MTDRFERFSMAIFNITRYWNMIATDVMMEYDLKGPYALYLLALAENEEGLTATELCDKVGKDKADISRAVNAMEKKRLVRREGEITYRAKVQLTESGKSLATEIGKIADKAVETAGFGISDDSRAEFYTSLEMISENLKQMATEGFNVGK